ncbi:carboxypeptidase family protein [Exilibacterium tricleocarpae]|uniref:Carboxypeptidase family protein n=1 Tax=Exilibacterium tricleocarpae TaxID=2591008 RepID=A0A545TVS6_9GAMM|nr:carboxypeptidase family protein [Exilibacterium tricleocarpae]TQV81330.1 carboxypeptidase family protein [Exilibacterium tricleocarpae]
MKISSDFTSGNIHCIAAAAPDNIRLSILPDHDSKEMQWFYFCLTGAANASCRMVIENAGQVSYVDGFRDYHAVASYDQDTWFRVPTDFDGESLTIRHQPTRDEVYYAYFAPYTLAQHRQLINRARESSLVSYQSLGKTPDGHEIELLTVGEAGAGKKTAWIIARQHPGETMAEWWMEGCIGRLLDSDDSVAGKLLSQYVFYLVPNMNPDGSARGHLRTNACGRDLNRAWLEPSEAATPEVFVVRQKMQQTGVDFCLDVHGDEALPYNFIAGAEGVPDWSPTRQQELDGYRHHLAELNPEFQTRYGYPVAAPGQGNLSMCTNYIAQHFGCLAMTLEMPFKDAANAPEPQQGWSPARCRKLARSCLEAML